MEEISATTVHQGRRKLKWRRRYNRSNEDMAEKTYVALLLLLNELCGGGTDFKLSHQLVLSCPEGYPRLAAFLDSDENFMLYRRFGFLHARLLLYKQDELRRLEMELDNMDQTDARENPIILQSRRKDDAEVGDRKKLLQTIDLKLKEYGALLLYTDRCILDY